MRRCWGDGGGRGGAPRRPEEWRDRATRLYRTDGICGHRARLRAAVRRVLRLQDHGGRARDLADDPARDHTQRPRQLTTPAGPARGGGAAGRALSLPILPATIPAAPVTCLPRRGLPRAWGMLAVIAALAATLWIFGLAVVPVVEAQSRQLVATFPELLEEAVALFNRVQGFFELGARISLDGGSFSELGRQLLTGSAVSTAAGVGLTVATAVSLGLVVLIATIYMVIRPEPWVEGFVSLFPAGWRQRTREILRELYHTVQRGVIGQLTAMSFIAVFWAVSLSVIGVPFALLLGILGGLISFVPYVGAPAPVLAPP